MRPPSRTRIANLSNPAEFDADDAGLARRIDRYDVVGILGRGGMGVVYDAVDGDTGEHYALKTVEVRFLQLEDTNASQRFEHEIHVLARLEHPGIVRMFDSGVARHPMGYDVAYYVMEKLDGPTLVPDIQESRRFDPPHALDIVIKLADALAYLDQNGVLHRDLKPGNILLERSGRVVLMDFGLARSPEFTRLTMTGQIVGTFAYMSPERLSGQELDITSDVFALGVVLFQLLVGRHPFGTGTPQDMMLAIHRGIQWPSGNRDAFGGSRGPALKQLVSDMLAPKPEGRLTPGQAKLQARAILDGKGNVSPNTETVHQAAPVRTPQPNVRAHHDPAEQPRKAAAPEQRSSRPSWAIAVMIAGTASCLAFVGGWFARGGAGPRPVSLSPKPRVPLKPTKPTRPSIAEVPAVVSAKPTAPAVATQPAIRPATAGAPVLRSAALVPPKPPVEEPAVRPTFSDPEAAFTFAIGELSQQRRISAIAALRRALELNPAHADAHRRLGDALVASGDPRAAVRHYKMYLALRPEAADSDLVRASLAEIKRK